jgi:hypothetical protein
MPAWKVNGMIMPKFSSYRLINHEIKRQISMGVSLLIPQKLSLVFCNDAQPLEPLQHVACQKSAGLQAIPNLPVIRCTLALKHHPTYTLWRA